MPWRRETNSSTRVIRWRNATVSHDRVSRPRRSQRHRSLTAAASCLLAHACINEGRFVLLVTMFMALNNSHRRRSRRSSSREETRANAVSPMTSSTELKAKFHYASWFGAGSKLVRCQMPLRYLDRTSFESASNQLRTGFRASSEPASVMEFGFYPTSTV